MNDKPIFDPKAGTSVRDELPPPPVDPPKG
jgi:hypothetical protein